VICVRQQGDAVVIDLLVSPRASRTRVSGLVGDRLKIAVHAPPVDGAANTEIVRHLARALKVPQKQVSIVRGDASRRKTVRVEGLSRDAVVTALSAS